MQLVTESMAEPPDLVAEISALFELILPNNAVPGVLARLDTSPHRAARIIEQQQAVAVS